MPNPDAPVAMTATVRVAFDEAHLPPAQQLVHALYRARVDRVVAHQLAALTTPVRPHDVLLHAPTPTELNLAQRALDDATDRGLQQALAVIRAAQQHPVLAAPALLDALATDIEALRHTAVRLATDTTSDDGPSPRPDPDAPTDG